MSNSKEISSQPVPRQMVSRRRLLAGASGLALALSLGLSATAPARADDTIKVGILHSLSGTMAISETTLKDVMLMLIDQQNKKGGLLRGCSNGNGDDDDGGGGVPCNSCEIGRAHV